LIETQRCLLQKIIPDDFKDIKKLYVNEDVRKYLGGSRKEADIQDSFSGMVHSKMESLYWVVRDKESNKFIGLVSLDTHHDKVSTEISYQLLPDWWGVGYATEIVSEILYYAFQVLKMPKVIAETQTANIASCKLLEKLGMKVTEKVNRFGAEQAIYSIHNQKE
jgi:[ribosomal protein S5]-alanine N-acetyltransferase